MANELFTNYASKLELWNNLEQQYDFKKDQAKTQKKLEEIYESLKQYFSKD
jgi:plasmid maintenance system antidote protein VapI